MAKIDGECSVLLQDGTACRRGARFACGQWHLVCTSHQPAPLGIEPAGCPLCGQELMAFSHIEAMVPHGRRSTDGILGGMNALFVRAREAFGRELHDEPESREDTLENEM